MADNIERTILTGHWGHATSRMIPDPLREK